MLILDIEHVLLFVFFFLDGFLFIHLGIPGQIVFFDCFIICHLLDSLDFFTNAQSSELRLAILIKVIFQIRSLNFAKDLFFLFHTQFFCLLKTHVSLHMFEAIKMRNLVINTSFRPLILRGMLIITRDWTVFLSRMRRISLLVAEPHNDYLVIKYIIGSY